MSALFTPFSLRSLTLPNRIGIPPMCQYSATDGRAGDWHLQHYASRAVGGAGLVIVEASAVLPEGRISPGDLGLWDEAQVAPLARIAAAIADQGAVPAIQLAHAGRKASVGRGWEAQRTLTAAEGGWTAVAPSALAFTGYDTPQELDAAAIAGVVAAFVAAAERARRAGFQAVEIHAAHGYLLHQFLSPLSNRRDDDYGGSFANRVRLTREVVAAVRAVWPSELPLLIRLSATDWLDGGWDAEQTVALCRLLRDDGVDLVDVSTGGLDPAAKIPAAPGFQVPFAARIRRETGLPVAAVGLITEAAQAEALVAGGEADLVLVGREILRNPYWPLQAAQALGVAAAWPAQYLRALPPGTPRRD
ncbi:2,4-dienoyl-CoA reductase-like NADH-dependent reductase (Old Yellow Enzyme family) [Azonexus fungiphilus]|uniref:2,4-dienoyl-CoA reductase-like NADH-dependent reductase (Old Yellow Enzyme family) n=1 Tax=Azonexus fungiphilus TaxID=146940 RepID=A0A495WIJ0_9RHOO|nr:NADH:flavin oxidoreductase/NADH oxidase [Azonexus fungiphilus]RKT60934.1 2,4-dienoyl-CoA reductase-like NADH-dependent reductase (Old Yellow Enzyme family) [Azonexus fungiphilus]